MRGSLAVQLANLLGQLVGDDLFRTGTFGTEALRLLDQSVLTSGRGLDHVRTDDFFGDGGIAVDVTRVVRVVGHPTEPMDLDEVLDHRYVVCLNLARRIAEVRTNH